MSATENRIVKMIFDNATFKKNATDTQSQLTALDKQVASAGKGKGLLDMAGHMDTVRVKAGAMQIAAVTAISNIANRAVNAGISIAKSLTIDPIKAGFDEYELKMKSIQTILANTKGENLASVSVALQELNEYSDKTIYNFANMTENIGKLTTAGINLKDATATVKGFSNMVALAGGDAFAAAGAMEQFGQGLQAGAIKAIDWASISTRGLGSQALQQAFFETARAAGALQDVPVTTTFAEWSKAQGGFKASLESGWLTTETATETLKIMTGDVTDMQTLLDQGFSEKAAKDMLGIAESALESATKVRTFTAFMGTLKEQIGSGWSQVIELIVGDFNEATKLFTGLSDFTGKVIGKIFGYIERLVKGFTEFGGRTAVLETFKNILSPIAAILGLIAVGWKKVFGGGDTGRGLATMAKALQHVTRPLRILGKLISGQITPLEAFRRVIEVFANGARNAGQFVGKLIKPLTDLVGISLPSGDGFFKWIKNLGEEIVRVINHVEELIDKGASLGGILGGAKSFDMPDLPGLPSLPSMGGIFGGDTDAETSKIAGLTGGIKNLGSSISDLKDDADDTPMFNPDVDISAGRVNDVGSLADQARAGAADLLDANNEVATVGDKMGGVLQGVKDVIGNFMDGFSFDDLLASFNMAVLATFMISISRFFNTLSRSFAGFVGTGEAINGVLGSAGDALGSFQTSARAKLILNIAIAIGILAVALWLLSRIPADKLATGLLGLAGIMTVMKVGVDQIIKAVEAMDSKGAVPKLAAFSLALMALAFAVLLLTAAFLLMRFVRWEDLAKGLLTIVVVLKMMEKLGNIAEGGAKNLAASALAISAIAFSMVILAGALLLFKLVDWESMAKAGLALGGVVAAIAILGKINTETIAKAGGSIALASVGLLLMANALLIFGMVSWESIVKAGVALTGLAAAFILISMFTKNPVAAAGFVAIAGAMVLLATAALILNAVDWSSIGKLALVLGVLVLGFGAFLAVISFFSPALILLSLFAGQLALLALALAGLALAFAIIFPLMAAGAGVFAAFATGAAVAFAIFLQSLALQAPIMKESLLKILQTFIDGIVEAVPMIIDGIKRLWDAVMEELGGGGGGKGGAKGLMMEKQGQSWISKLADGIKKKLPEIISKGVELLKGFLDGLIKNAGTLSAKGAELVTNLIKGIASRIGGIVDAAVDLIVKFAEGLGRNLDRLVKAGMKLIADFLHALASGIRSGSAAIGGGLTDVLDAMKDVGVDMVKGLIAGIGEMFGDAMGAIGDLASGMVDKAKGILDIFSPSRVFKSIGKFLVEGLTNGIQENAASAITSVASMVSGQIAVANEYVSGFIQKLDQQALAASAKASGLMAAAETAAAAADKAANRADKTKGKKDDKAANKAGKRAENLQEAANKASKKAERQELRAQEAKDAQDRAAEFAESTLLEQAQMRSEDAATQMDAAKAAEFKAAANLAEADALDAASKGPGLSKKQRKEMREEADRLRKAAERQAKEANAQIALARVSAGDALNLQRLSGAEAAAAYQKQFDDEAQEDANTEAYNKLSDTEKAAQRRREAEALQAKANQDLQAAKQLAYTDLEAANELAEQANAQAEQARQYLLDAAQLELNVASGTGSSASETGGTVVNLDATEAASIAFGNYEDLYDAGVASAAGGNTVEFNQYNTSPESLNPTDVYRNTNNQLASAVDKLPKVA